MRALYLGRFQPFHMGHLNIIKGLAEKYDEVVIGLCSAQCSHTLRNPFTYVERYQMITLALSEVNIHNYKIVPIPDINHWDRWADFCNEIFGEYDVVVTNNPDTRKLFEKRGDKVEGFKITKRDGASITGTRTREVMSKSEHDVYWWKQLKVLVPEAVYYYIRFQSLELRMRKLNE